ncbi:MAG TPA: hypothetical protein VIF10_07310 [Methylobacter sp.]|jgi:hypothetical protein
MKINQKPLQLALHGMDERTQKMMVMFLQGPCQGAAMVAANSHDAQANVIDADIARSQAVLIDIVDKQPEKPVIVLSLQDGQPEQEKLIYVKKPVTSARMLAALEQAKNLIARHTNPSTAVQPDSPLADTQDSQVNPLKTIAVNNDDRAKSSKHQAAMHMDEQGFSAFIGIVPNIDFSDPDQLSLASYNAKLHFQGAVQSAYKFSLEKMRAINLGAGWKPLLILPDNREIWLNADDKMLRAFAGIKINPQSASISAIDQRTHSVIHGQPEKFQDMNAFLWKLAIWTSKGRYPQELDVTKPVYLKRWPEFTRWLITPHAMRIAALLIQSPRTMLNIAQVLNVNPRYVFVFVSAAHAVGLVEQGQRESDTMIEPPTQPNERKSLMSRIISKLRRD